MLPAVVVEHDEASIVLELGGDAHQSCHAHSFDPYAGAEGGGVVAQFRAHQLGPRQPVSHGAEHRREQDVAIGGPPARLDGRGVGLRLDGLEVAAETDDDDGHRAVHELTEHTSQLSRARALLDDQVVGPLEGDGHGDEGGQRGTRPRADRGVHPVGISGWDTDPETDEQSATGTVLPLPTEPAAARGLMVRDEHTGGSVAPLCLLHQVRVRRRGRLDMAEGAEARGERGGRTRGQPRWP